MPFVSAQGDVSSGLARKSQECGSGIMILDFRILILD